MRLRPRIFTAFLIALMMLAGAATAQTQSPAPPSTPAAPGVDEARRTLDILQDPQKLAALIQTLRTIAEATPASTAPAAAAAPAPAPPAAAPAPANPPASAITLAPDSLGAQLVPAVSGWTGRVAQSAAAMVAEISQAPLLWRVLRRTAVSAEDRRAIVDAAWRTAVVMLCAVLVHLLASLLLSRPIRGLEARAPGPDRPRNAWESARRLPFSLGRLALELIPVGLLAGTGYMAAGLVGGGPRVPPLAVAVVNAYAIGAAILCGVRLLVSRDAPRLRLLPVEDQAAAAISVWARRITIVSVAGGGLAEIALAIGLPERASDALVRLTALVVAILFGAAVIGNRRAVADYIRSDRDGAALSEGRRWLAETWHFFALAAIIALWLVTVGGQGHRFASLDVVLGTIGVLVGARLVAILALGALARSVPHEPGAGGRFGAHAAHYHRALRLVITAAIVAGTAVLLLQVWGADALAWFEPGAIGQHLVSAVATIVLAAAIAAIVWESVNAALDREVYRLQDAEPMRSARLRTLLPIMRTALLITILVVVGATALAEIGVNIAPLLAGAGIVGIAVGFGAQTLVHDIITGMFILIENTIQVGDGVTVAGLTGSVEALSLRTLRLRAGDGALHIVPFSSVVTVTNNNRGIGNAAVSVLLRADQDIDLATAELVAIGTELRADAAFAPMILGDFALWGVDSITAAGVTITGQIPCTVSGKMPVQREFNRRILRRFADSGIALATFSGPPAA